jgi:hypothetical protein
LAGLGGEGTAFFREGSVEVHSKAMQANARLCDDKSAMAEEVNDQQIARPRTRKVVAGRRGVWQGPPVCAASHHMAATPQALAIHPFKSALFSAHLVISTDQAPDDQGRGDNYTFVSVTLVKATAQNVLASTKLGAWRLSSSTSGWL